jgi:hypothetical protein
MQSRESGGYKKHKETHQCEADPCVEGIEYRKMEEDEWVKFGWAL